MSTKDPTAQKNADRTGEQDIETLFHATWNDSREELVAKIRELVDHPSTKIISATVRIQTLESAARILGAEVGKRRVETVSNVREVVDELDPSKVDTNLSQSEMRELYRKLLEVTRE